MSLDSNIRGRLLAVAAVVAGALLPACGGSGPASSSSPAPTPDAFAAGTAISVVSGETGQPVTGARVSVADRVTRFALWPRTSPLGIDDTYTATVVYTAAAGAAPGSSPMLRLRAGTSQVVLVPSSELARDGGASAQIARSAATINDALHGRLTYLVAPVRPASGVVFDLFVNAADPQCQRPIAGYTLTTLAGSEITGGLITFCRLDYARTSIATHEIGHTFGLQHSPDGRELMTGIFFRESGPRVDRFSARETMIMQLMQERRAGNRFPDNDRDVSASALRTLVTACP
jgi:Matrixin